MFQELGKRGIQFNGSTSFDRTNYYETFPANDANLAWTLAMEAERMTKSLFAKAELDTEMTVVRNEFETGENNPYLRAVEAAAGGRLRLAQLRQHAHRRALRHRERAVRATCARSTSATTSRTTPC